VASGGGGVIQWAPDWVSYDDVGWGKIEMDRVHEYLERELVWMTDIAREHGSKVKMTWILSWGFDEEISRQIADLNLLYLDKIKEAGGVARAQLSTRPPGFLLAMDAGLHPFRVSTSFYIVNKLFGRDGLMRRLREPFFREKILSETAEVWDLPELKEPGVSADVPHADRSC